MSSTNDCQRSELYVGVFRNHTWTLKSLRDYFSQLIEGLSITDCRFHQCGDGNYRDQFFAILTFASFSSVDRCLAKRDQIRKEHHLTIQRHLNEVQREQRRISSSVFIHLERFDQSFSKENVLAYFGQYGSIIQCRILHQGRTFLLNFEDYDSVDRILYDQTHFLNDQSLVIRKCFDSVILQRTYPMNTLLKDRIRNIQALINRLQYSYEYSLRNLEKQIQEDIHIKEDRLLDMMKSYIRLERIQRDLKRDLIVTCQINQQLKKLLHGTARKNRSIVDEYENQLE